MTPTTGQAPSSVSIKKTIQDIDVAGKTVLVRVDYNVPFRPGTAEISDDTRIKASLPTVLHMLDQRCKTVLCSHLGRPNGSLVEEMRVGPVSTRLSELLGQPVAMAPDCVGPEVSNAVHALTPGEILMLENLRFHSEEEQNDPDFARELSSLAEIYVNDAFGTAHRAHASTVGVTRYLPAVAGFLMARELEMLGRITETPERPFAAVLGGAKVSDKLTVLESLAGKADVILIGGGMAATFLKAQGLEVGDSPIEEDRLPSVAKLLREAGERGLQMLLPEDVVIADSFAESAGYRTVDAGEIPQTWRIMDIGPRTAAAFERALESAKTVVWNGPMGVFEWVPFADGTTRIARALAGLTGATTLVGGGSTAEVVEKLEIADEMTHVSTGGGASLELLEGKTLPGVAALMDRV